MTGSIRILRQKRPQLMSRVEQEPKLPALNMCHSKSACRVVSVSKPQPIDPHFTPQPGEHHTVTSLDMQEVQNISPKP